MKLLQPATLSLTVTRFSIAAPLAEEVNHKHWSSPEIVHQFSAGTWIENLAVRSNGNILATDNKRSLLYEVDPFHEAPESVLHQFQGIASIIGIVEGEQDVFYVTSSNYSSTIFEGYGQFFVYRVDLRSYPRKQAQVAKIADVPDAGILNGLAYLAESNKILIADSFEGVVWSVDTATSDVAVAINNSYTRYPEGFGVNGIKPLGSQLYFTSSSQEIYARVPIDSNGNAKGGVEVLASKGFLPDDFALDSQGNAYITSFANGDNGVVFVPADGGDWSKMARVKGPTAAAFGRTAADCNVLYVSTTGGDYKTAPNGTFIGAGTITGIKINGVCCV